eukprot:2608009-Pleurochrysis_carterae.AAC.1
MQFVQATRVAHAWERMHLHTVKAAWVHQQLHAEAAKIKEKAGSSLLEGGWRQEQETTLLHASMRAAL